MTPSYLTDLKERALHEGRTLRRLNPRDVASLLLFELVSAIEKLEKENLQTDIGAGGVFRQNRKTESGSCKG